MTGYAYIIGIIIVLLVFAVTKFVKPFSTSNSALIISLRVMPISLMMLLLVMYAILSSIDNITGIESIYIYALIMVLLPLCWVWSIVNSLIKFTKFRRTRNLLVWYLFSFVLTVSMFFGVYKIAYYIDYNDIITIEDKYNGIANIDDKFSLKTRSYPSFVGRAGSLLIIFKSGKTVELLRNNINIQVYNLDDDNIFISTSALQYHTSYIIDYQNEKVYFVSESNNVYEYDKDIAVYSDDDKIPYDDKILKNKKHIGEILGSKFKKIENLL